MRVQQPPPRLPARVYWVRRLVVVGIPLLIIVLVIAWLNGRGGEPEKQATPDAATTTTSAPPKESPRSSPTPTTEPGGIADCSAATLGLALTPAAVAFGPGVSPSFDVVITNTGSEPCLVDAGEASREIVITSGDDRVWDNRDCVAQGTETRDLLLPAGGSDTTQLAWNRIRSAPGCPDGLPAPGAGTYSAQLTLAGAAAAPAVFGLS